jgi:hypothetical protein
MQKGFHMHPALTGDLASGRGAQLDRRLHDIAWGLLLTLTGIIWLIPNDRVPEGVWLFGVAAVLLGVNVVRYLNQIKVNGFSMVLGFVALVAALSRTLGLDLPLLALCFIVIGASLLAKPLLTRPT